MGALMGALYTRYQNSKIVKQVFDDLIKSPEFDKLGFKNMSIVDANSGFWDQVTNSIQNRVVMNIAQSRKGIIPNVKLHHFLENVLTENVWSKDGVRFATTATDIIAGEDVYFTDGSLLDAVEASMSIPGFVPPIPRGDQLLVDGGVSQIVPISLAKFMGADFVIAVDVAQTVNPVAQLDNATQIVAQSEGITAFLYRERLLKEADFVFTIDIPGSHWSEFHRSEEFIHAGTEVFNRQAENLEKIIKTLHTPMWKQKLKQMINLKKN